MAVEGRTQESDIEIRSEKGGRRHRPEIGDALTLVNLQGVVMRDGNGKLWIGITDLFTPSGDVMAHLIPGLAAEVTGEVEDGLEVVTEDDPTTPRPDGRRLVAFRLKGALLDYIEEQLGD